MERYRENSAYHKEPLLWMWLSIAALLAWLGYVGSTYLAGKLNYTALAYIIFFSGLLIWRYAVKYTYILTENEFTIISRFMGLSRTYTVSLHAVESYSNKYIKKFFKRTGMSRYIYRYNSGDGQPTRILVFSQKGKLSAVLFKASDRFIEELQQLMPEKFLDMQNTK